MGIVVPHVNNKEEAENVVEGGKFYPVGKRGSFTSRQGIGVKDYHDLANDQTMFIILIEDIIAVENLDSILSVDNIDVFFLASGDLAQSMGFPGQSDHKEVQKVVDESLKRISARGKISGAIGNKSNVKSLYENGVKFYLCDPRPYMADGFQKYQDFAQKALEK
jgi:2-keto-3-deoxy-L-rhamnonate aldolase RhmA